MRTTLQIILGIAVFVILINKNTPSTYAVDNERDYNIVYNNDCLHKFSESIDDTIETYVPVENTIEEFVAKKNPTKQQESKNTTQTNYKYKISDKGKQFIIKYEKCHLISYADLGGGYTVGYGHHGKDVKANMKISQKQAEKYFNKDIQETEEYARFLIDNLPYKCKFSQGFFDGLCDLIYNAGVGAVQRSTFYKRLQNCRIVNGNINKQDYEYVLAAVLTLNAPYKGHKIRRKECHEMMK